MKNTFTLLMVMLLPFIAFSQRNFERFSIGIGGGITRNQGDLSRPQSKDLITGNFDYFISPYIQTGIEFQSGKIYGNEISSRYYQNHFKSFFFLIRVHAGQFMRQRGYPTGEKATFNNLLKGIYAGTGIGAVLSNQKKIYRDAGDIDTFGSDKNFDAAIPAVIGVDNSGFNSKVITGISYQGHFALSDQLDGYSPSGSKKDYYSAVVVSVKLRLGPVGVY